MRVVGMCFVIGIVCGLIAFNFFHIDEAMSVVITFTVTIGAIVLFAVLHVIVLFLGY